MARAFFSVISPRTSRVSFPAISPHLSKSEADVSVSSSVPLCVWLCDAANPIVFMHVFNWRRFCDLRGDRRGRPATAATR